MPLLGRYETNWLTNLNFGKRARMKSELPRVAMREGRLRRIDWRSPSNRPACGRSYGDQVFRADEPVPDSQSLIGERAQTGFRQASQQILAGANKPNGSCPEEDELRYSRPLL
jgi:hypothetical protein